MQHLQVLGDSGLVRSEKLGRVRTYHIEPDVLNSAGHWINARKIMWESRLDKLGDYLNEQVSNPGSKT
jgi:DNA-binding transcriptional ArsR family regulator